MLTRKAWSPYFAGIVIGLLQIPAFLLIETALGTSSSYVTVGGTVASWVDPSILKIDYVVRHVAATGKNWWQVALVFGIAVGAFLSMKLSGAKRHAISPIWQRALGSRSPARRSKSPTRGIWKSGCKPPRRSNPRRSEARRTQCVPRLGISRNSGPAP